MVGDERERERGDTVEFFGGWILFRVLRGESMIFAPRDPYRGLFIFRNDTNNVCSPWHLCRDKRRKIRFRRFFFLSPSCVLIGSSSEGGGTRMGRFGFTFNSSAGRKSARRARVFIANSLPTLPFLITSARPLRVSFIPLFSTCVVLYIDKIIHRTYSVHTFYLVSLLLRDSLLTPRKLLGAAATRNSRRVLRSRKNIRDI